MTDSSLAGFSARSSVLCLVTVLESPCYAAFSIYIAEGLQGFQRIVPDLLHGH